MRFRFLFVVVVIAPWAARGADGPKLDAPRDRKGDEMIVAGRFIHTGTPIVTWIDKGGYDAYDLARRFPEAAAKDAPKTVKPGYGERKIAPNSSAAKLKKDGEWTLPALQEVVDQFVIHYDVCGTSRRCFRVLHDERELSVHFMLDLDGTIYQTLDLKERAWHATVANTRSIGIEIANMGATPPAEFAAHLGKWYKTDGDGKVEITIPGPASMNGVRDLSKVLRPSRNEPVVGKIQGETLEQYDLTPQQYAALIKLTAALHATFPKIKLDYPRGADGKVAPKALAAPDYNKYEGMLGHWHVQTNKTDPGPAFDWDRVIEGARAVPRSQ